MKRFGGPAIGLALLLGSAWPIAGPPAAVCASAREPTAALVVDNGQRVLKLCVELDATSVSGLHLIELAGQQHGLAYSFGFGGQAVCRLDGVGPAGEDCFASYPEYWGYWHGNGSGGWTWASTGAAGYRVGDGDVEGWVWGTGDNGATHDAPPATRHDEVCAEQEPGPSPSPEPSPSPKPSPAKSPQPSASPDPAGSKTEQSPSRSESQTSPAPRTRTPSAVPMGSPGPEDGPSGLAAAPAQSPGPPSGPSLGLALAVALGLLLAGGGWLRLRSRGVERAR